MKKQTKATPARALVNKFKAGQFVTLINQSLSEIKHRPNYVYRIAELGAKVAILVDKDGRMVKVELSAIKPTKLTFKSKQVQSRKYWYTAKISKTLLIYG